MAKLKCIDHPSFPATAPINHPHIIRNEEPPYAVSVRTLRLCDAITTLLHNLESQHPGTVTAFFDPTVKEFKLNRLSMQGKGGSQMDLMIWRTNKQVITLTSSRAGFYNRYKFIEWEAICKSMINPNGSWRTIWGARSASSELPLEQFKKQGFFDINLPMFTRNNPNDEKEAAEVAKALGVSVWRNELWADYDKPIFTIEVKRQGGVVERTESGGAPDENGKVEGEDMEGGKTQNEEIESGRVAKRMKGGETEVGEAKKRKMEGAQAEAKEASDEADEQGHGVEK